MTGSGVGASADNYAAKVEREIAHYRDIEKVHALPPLHHYWARRYVRPKFLELGLEARAPFLIETIGARCREAGGRTVELVSIGAGNCDQEVAMAADLLAGGVENFRIDCLDVNPSMLNRGREAAAARGLGDKLEFVETDIKDWAVVDSRYAVCLAIQSLHHFAELETLFEKIRRTLRADGTLYLDEIVGRNGHMRWPEAGYYVREIWDRLPARYKYDHQTGEIQLEYVERDCSADGFEGIRAQDILPLLLEYFHFELFIGFGNIIDRFVDRSFGPNFNLRNERDRAFIDEVAQLDDRLIDEGTIKPTRVFAGLRLHPVAHPKWYQDRSPERCVRPPRPMDPELTAPPGQPIPESLLETCRLMHDEG